MSAKKDDHSLGLTDNEVLQNREKYGVNLLTPPKRPSLWKLYLEKFEDPVVRVLLVAAVFSLMISIIENEYAETIGIIAAILLATGIGFYFEYDASKKFDLLNAVNEETPVKVIRNGRIQEIPRKDVVVGDVIVLETGEEIPADGELLESISLEVNESNLTGEPVVSKTTVEADYDEEATYASNTVMRGTTVVDGHGTMRVSFVGDNTEIGKVARQSTEQSMEPTPLNIQLTKLANLIGKIGFTVAGLAFLIFFVKDVLLAFDFSTLNSLQDWLPVLERTLKYFMMAVTLIVVAVPEGLPMSVTLSLALNMRRMLSTNNLVRKMHACETMGAITVICTDKTGTLTQNLMQVHEPNFYSLKNKADLVGDDISGLIAEGISVNSTAFLEEINPGEKPKGVGNPTEVALLLWLNSQQINYLELREKAHIIDQLTFSTERKFMATLVDSPAIGKKVLYIKGAPEIVLGKCKEVILDGSRVDAVEYRSTIEAQLLKYQNMAMRTLGFAYKIVEADEKINACAELVSANDLNFLGVVAISDPIRPDVPAAVAKCQSAGIGIKIVTGDTPGTATEIARQI
ncbi:MAG TPA: HAD-IC family P-type ATPase, partial [Bacteroides reticulotermitis]|nr:HAD-IC family P-type ATPase [Bacteroides reticulotermitis]